jgi:hypothetical protein
MLGKSSPLARAFFRSRRYEAPAHAPTHQRPNGEFQRVSKRRSPASFALTGLLKSAIAALG